MTVLLLPPAVSALLKGLKGYHPTQHAWGWGGLFKYPGFVWVSVPGTGLKGVGAKGRSRRGREREDYGGKRERSQADIVQASQRENEHSPN